MSRYSTPFCSDEELLKELNKLGYDEVPPEVFERMKDDLSDLVSKNEDNHCNTAENEHDLAVSEYGYNNESPQSSKYLGTSDDLSEWRTTQENCRKADSRVSRKTKRKSQKTSLRHLNNHDDEVFGLEYNKFHNTDNALEVRRSRTSLEYSNIDEDDVLSEFGNSQDKRAKVNKSKSNDIYASRNSKIDHNRNEGNSSISKNRSPKESDFELSYSFKDDGLGSAVSISKIKNKVAKENKSKKSWEKIQEIPDTQNILNDNTFDNVNEAFKAFNLDEDYCNPNESTVNDYKCSNVNLNTSDITNSERKTIKRKVLRRRNGRSVITEELVEIPSIFDTSYPESENLNSSKSFSSDDLSYKSNSSTGSVNILSPESSIKSSPSTFSLSSRSTSLRISNTRKKKSDPVAMYNYYKKFWDNFKPPGENTHDRLRWAVRDKMLEYNI